jgi:hypothetical protein
MLPVIINVATSSLDTGHRMLIELGADKEVITLRP